MGVTRDLAATLTLPGPASNAVMRQGVVTAVNSDGTVTLTLGGSAATVEDAVCLANVLPYVGATVWCAEFGQDLLVVGVQEVATGWVTSTTGFTAAANFATTSVRWRRVGVEVDLYVVMARNTSALTVAAGDGNITNVDVLTAIPAAIQPSVPQYGHSGGTGRALTGLVSGATVSIAAVAGDGTNITTSDSVSLAFRYWVD